MEWNIILLCKYTLFIIKYLYTALFPFPNLRVNMFLINLILQGLFLFLYTTLLCL
ncbi:hypothetical protein BDF14DRAFT_1754516 [Spinellus fusiger]|nr:hypothetical protein BDF14DRAFT_1754516 [Spinellus fusiger]